MSGSLREGEALASCSIDRERDGDEDEKVRGRTWILPPLEAPAVDVLAEGKDGVAREADAQAVVVRDGRVDAHGRGGRRRVEEREKRLLRAEDAGVGARLRLLDRVVELPDLSREREASTTA